VIAKPGDPMCRRSNKMSVADDEGRLACAAQSRSRRGGSGERPLDAVAMSCCARYRVATAVDATGSKQLLKNRLPQVVAALTFSLTPHAQLAPFGSSVVAL